MALNRRRLPATMIGGHLLLLLTACSGSPFDVLPGMKSSASSEGSSPGSEQTRLLAPIIHAMVTSPSNLVKGQPVTFDIKATDPNGKLLEYRWSSSKGVLSATTGQLVHWAPPDEDGVFAVQVIVINTEGHATSGTINLIVEGNGIKPEVPVITEPGTKLPSLKERVVAVVGKDIALIDYVNPGEPVLYLTKNDIDESQPDLSPDGSRIAYIRNGQVFMTSIGGKHIPLEKNTDCMDPVWKTDGTQVLYRRRGDDNKPKAYSVAGQSGAIPGLRVGYYTDQASWAGSEIVYTSSFRLYRGSEEMFGSIPSRDNRYVKHFVCDSEGEIATQVNGSWSNEDALFTSRLGQVASEAYEPFAYREGIVFATKEERIVAIDEGTGEIRIIATRTHWQYASFRPCLSPDGKHVVYVSKNKDPRLGSDSPQLFSVAVQGGNPVQLTFEASGVTEPSF
ncbi:translocation protein TolB [compost metagenome]